jgi:hypothetical protein
MASMGHGMAGMAMDTATMMKRPHAMARWVDFVLLGLAAWLVASPATLGNHSAALAWSDVLSGLLLAVLAVLALDTRRGWAAYAATMVGVWLVFAPLVFWAPDAAAYLNDTLVGGLVIGFALILPMGMEMPGPQVPAGWSYNPATWAQRVPLLALALVGLLLSRYLAAYQLGHTDWAWDPFFGDGTMRILKSDVSHMFPVSDAGLGAATYLLELLMLSMGDARRWRTMPWMVAFFAILVVPLGVTSIVLVILQPLAVGTWCTACLVAAFSMLIMVPLTLDEVVAMAQFLAQRTRAGQSFWRTFWLGGNVPEGQEARPTRPVNATSVAAATWGITLPWSLLASVALGGWLMAAPGVLGTRGAAANGDQLVGALVVTVAMLALAEVARPVRFLNVLFGIWLLVQPWLLGASGLALASDLLVGILLILLSLPRGAVRETYGGWDRFIR